MKQALHFGAGNIGRGFIGSLLYQAGFELAFADVNTTLINKVNELKQYRVVTIEDNPYEILVKVDTSYDINQNHDELIQKMVGVDLITTAVGPNVLAKLAPLFALAFESKAKSNKETFVNVIACENVIAGSSILKEEIYKHLSKQTRSFVDKWVGFPSSAVDRIVPVQENKDPLLVQVEPFYEWVIDQNEVKGNLDINLAVFTSNLQAFIERKLYLVNAAHAAIAYAGYLKGNQTISEALQDEQIVELASEQMKEAAALLSKKHEFDYQELIDYSKKTLDRFKKPEITDFVHRVARSPLRKLSANDRFIKPLKELYQFNLESSHFVKSIKNALKYDYPEDEEAVMLQEKINNLGLIETLKEVCGLESNDPLLKAIYKD